MSLKEVSPAQELSQIVARSKTIHFNYALVNKALKEKLTLGEIQELSSLYSELNRKYGDLVQAYTTLLLTNQRLVNENEFMLKLVQEKQEKD